VTILEGTDDLFAGSYDRSMTSLVKKSLKNKGAEVITNALAKGVEEKEDGVVVTYEHKGETKTIEADYVAVVVGRRPNTSELGLEQAGVKVNERGLIEVDKQCRTNVPNIYAIGDIVPGPQLAHKASYEAKIAAAAISGLKDEVDILVFRQLYTVNQNWQPSDILSKKQKKKELKSKSGSSLMQQMAVPSV